MKKWRVKLLSQRLRTHFLFESGWGVGFQSRVCSVTYISLGLIIKQIKAIFHTHDLFTTWYWTKNSNIYISCEQSNKTKKIICKKKSTWSRVNHETQERNPDYPSGDRSIHAVRLLDFRKSFSKPPAATAKKKQHPKTGTCTQNTFP